ncbi:class I SAM-dependent methyltransferase [Longimicrobium terrae]|uniref:SAM-dependent methyltransferase n=1 Tax=Longimicrobium terrae TaxID=1639882 RepID=A0A841GUG8_9BACT|nr:class I SAM-dependent methyltransferase [Longimicrobium terrae]MBB4634092.1 SAM-dependent methyltransferase [Longimicrobium terrae]MBB6069018.1 SAM-dependent methyltransferase [Longimicrobium terrae]NNC28195.1 class I SAM-dependent methyltransferase [Longimicrobium terrae]
MRNYHKIDMASTKWLTTHFLAKSAFRIRSLASLPIQNGAKVLDLCCGPGLYIPYLLDLVGPAGHVTGVDRDPVSLDAAHQRLSVLPNKNWRLEQSSFEDFVPRISDYDVVIIFNSIGYFSNPYAVVEDIAQRLTSGAMIVIKDFDLESFFFQPRDCTMWADLINSAKKMNDDENPVCYDNFFGRKVHSLHRAYPFKTHVNETWTQYMHFPFNELEQEYIWRNIECLLNQAGSSCPSSAEIYFKKLFYPSEPKFFSNPDSMFVEVEYVTQLTV